MKTKLMRNVSIAAATAIVAVFTGCDMWMDTPVDASPDYYVGVGSTGVNVGVNVGVGSPYWNYGWSAPLWTGGYRPAWIAPPIVVNRPINPPIAPTRPGGSWNPAPVVPPQPATPPSSGHRPGAPTRP